MEGVGRGRRVAGIEEQYAGYTVYDRDGEKIGKVDDLFLDENDQPEYFGVKMGFLGTSSTLIPADIATVNNEQGFIEVSQTKDSVKSGPAFDDDREITPEYENEVRSYYDLALSAPREAGSGEVGSHADHRPAAGERSGGHLLLGDLAEGELAAMTGRQGIAPAARGSGLSNVSREHDRYLAEGSAGNPVGNPVEGPSEG